MDEELDPKKSGYSFRATGNCTITRKMHLLSPNLYMFHLSDWKKKKDLYWELSEGGKKNKRPESARFMFFPTKHPYSWTTGALELIISSLWAFDPLPTEPGTAQMPPTAPSHPMQPGPRMHPGMRPRLADITQKAASSACDPLGWPFNSRLLGL